MANANSTKQEKKLSSEGYQVLALSMTEIKKHDEIDRLRKRLNAAETNQLPPKTIEKIKKELHEREAQARLLASIVNGMAKGNEKKQTQNDHHNNDAEESNEDEDTDESGEYDDKENIEDSSEHEDDSDKKENGDRSDNGNMGMNSGKLATTTA